MVNASISEMYDLSTTVNEGTVLKIHTPIGNNVKRHLLGFFLQYKKFRYIGAKVTLVPASTLPADPLQLSYAAGEATIDPRDMVNPILWRHYHGEAMLSDPLPKEEQPAYGNLGDLALNGEYLGSSVTEQNYLSGGTIDTVYPQCLMDPSFRKAGVQAGFSTFVKPFVYKLATNAQILPNQTFVPGASASFSDGVTNAQIGGAGGVRIYSNTESVDETGIDSYKTGSSGQPVFTNRLESLGWMDTLTRSVVTTEGSSPYASAFPVGGAAGSGPNRVGANVAVQTFLPNIPMLYIMLPPAYKSLFYFRLIIKHYFAFSGFRSCMNVQSYGAANLVAPIPQMVPSTTTQALAEMVDEISDGNPDSLIVENGEIVSTADGVL
uniref:Uncharacterized protein n=1 Tax=uncultured prokaryote TaxID=198431 RepID=A0A0H5Q539_9ZZZZ|nr:hypothetical protein [uncultured prokaryote]